MFNINNSFDLEFRDQSFNLSTFSEYFNVTDLCQDDIDNKLKLFLDCSIV